MLILASVGAVDKLDCARTFSEQGVKCHATQGQLKASAEQGREIQAAKEAEIRRLQEALENEREMQHLKDQLMIVKAEAANHQSSSDVLNELMRLGKAKINEKGEFQLI